MAVNTVLVLFALLVIAGGGIAIGFGSYTAHAVMQGNSTITPPAPDPVPTPSPPAALPAIPTDGLLCTLVPDEFLDITEECPPDDFALCDEWRDEGVNQTCISETCTPLMYTDGYFYLTQQETDTANYSSALLYPDPLGEVSMPEMLAQFIADNEPDSLDPVTPAPQPFTTPVLFTDAEWNVDSFEVPPRELARQLAVTKFNYDFIDVFAVPEGAAETMQTMVFTPSRCPDDDVAALPWLAENNVTMQSVYLLTRCLVGFNVAGNMSEAAPFQEQCALCTDPTLCYLFPTYYAYAELADYEATPSFWRDVTSIFTLFNNAFNNCANTAAAACFGSDYA
jgi:hypothetical protein